jgi:hypothetical protein
MMRISPAALETIKIPPPASGRVGLSCSRFASHFSSPFSFFLSQRGAPMPFWVLKVVSLSSLTETSIRALPLDIVLYASGFCLSQRVWQRKRSRQRRLRKGHRLGPRRSRTIWLNRPRQRHTTFSVSRSVVIAKLDQGGGGLRAHAVRPPIQGAT